MTLEHTLRICELEEQIQRVNLLFRKYKALTSSIPGFFETMEKILRRQVKRSIAIGSSKEGALLSTSALDKKVKIEDIDPYLLVVRELQGSIRQMISSYDHEKQLEAFRAWDALMQTRS